jgi:hypothetical protein
MGATVRIDAEAPLEVVELRDEALAEADELTPRCINTLEAFVPAGRVGGFLHFAIGGGIYDVEPASMVLQSWLAGRGKANAERETIYSARVEAFTTSLTKTSQSFAVIAALILGLVHGTLAGSHPFVGASVPAAPAGAVELLPLDQQRAHHTYVVAILSEVLAAFVLLISLMVRWFLSHGDWAEQLQHAFEIRTPLQLSHAAMSLSVLFALVQLPLRLDLYPHLRDSPWQIRIYAWALPLGMLVAYGAIELALFLRVWRRARRKGRSLLAVIKRKAA